MLSRVVCQWPVASGEWPAAGREGIKFSITLVIVMWYSTSIQERKKELHISYLFYIDTYDTHNAKPFIIVIIAYNVQCVKIFFFSFILLLHFFLIKSLINSNKSKNKYYIFEVIFLFPEIKLYLFNFFFIL